MGSGKGLKHLWIRRCLVPELRLDSRSSNCSGGSGVISQTPFQLEYGDDDVDNRQVSVERFGFLLSRSTISVTKIGWLCDLFFSVEILIIRRLLP